MGSSFLIDTCDYTFRQINYIPLIWMQSLYPGPESLENHVTKRCSPHPTRRCILPYKVSPFCQPVQSHLSQTLENQSPPSPTHFPILHWGCSLWRRWELQCKTPLSDQSQVFILEIWMRGLWAREKKIVQKHFHCCKVTLRNVLSLGLPVVAQP